MQSGTVNQQTCVCSQFPPCCPPVSLIFRLIDIKCTHECQWAALGLLLTHTWRLPAQWGFFASLFKDRRRWAAVSHGSHRPWGRAIRPAVVSINAPEVAPSRMLLLPGSIKSGPHSSPTADVQTRRANTEVAWTCGQAGTHSRHGQSYPWMISRETISLFLCFWLEINILFAKIFTFSLSTPQSPCFIGCLIWAGKQIKPSNNPARTQSTKHCCVIQDAMRTVAEWRDMQPTRCECAFCIPKHLISGGGNCMVYVRLCVHCAIKKKI